jgi:hypothetical protein
MIDQEVDTLIMRSKVTNNAFLSINLIIDLLVTRMIMRSKVTHIAFLTVDLLIKIVKYY